MNRVIHLPEYGFLGISGKDAVKFFQGYSTCELADLNGEKSGIGATCNLKGRMVASYRLIANNEGLLLRMDRRLIEPMIEFLKKYIVFSKATLDDLSERYCCYGQIISTSGGEHATIPCPTDLDLWAETTWGPVVCVKPAAGNTSGSSVQRCELWFDKAKNQEQKPPLCNADEDAWHQAEIDQGLAWVTMETSEEFIPQMFGYDKINAINFDKGCYLGQEIVARMQYRGAVKRSLYKGSVSSQQKVGSTLLDNKGRTSGIVVSSSQTTLLAVVQIQPSHEPESKQESQQESQPKSHDAPGERDHSTERELRLANGESILLKQVIH